MYNKNLPGRAGLTPEFEDGVKTFIKWAKGQRRLMDGDKISLLFQSICSTTLMLISFMSWKIVLPSSCAILRRYFRKLFFDSIEHLIVHLPYEACVGGLVQYMWIYPSEGFLHELKNKYFESNVQSKQSMPRRNDECTSINDGFQVSIFNYPDRASGATKKRWLSGPNGTSSTYDRALHQKPRSGLARSCSAQTPAYVTAPNDDDDECADVHYLD
ncbi:hypothetical protein Sango_2081700 [Sesamum angolense]|uniref:DUF4218 domain-containing protein n=1 Tax=Sesamum angolense TaxID=2727404 RepID=A0AAE2BLW8_9LAMI|nr:hypothetical protein Sango_2081700 [Sesamum angolense]